MYGNRGAQNNRPTLLNIANKSRDLKAKSGNMLHTGLRNKRLDLKDDQNTIMEEL
jgi:hypothetical protein